MKINEIEVNTFVRIEEIGIIPTNIEIYEKTYTKDDGTSFDVYVFDLEDQKEVRIPKTVIAQLQAQMTENPDLKAFKVNKSGSGLQTAYTVIPK